MSVEAKAASPFEEVMRFLKTAGNVQRRALMAGDGTLEAARQRHVLAEASWASICGDDDSPNLLEAREIIANTDRSGEVPPDQRTLLFSATRLLNESLNADPHLARQIFQSVLRPLGEALGFCADTAAIRNASNIRSWGDFAETIVPAFDEESSHPLLVEAFAGLMRVRAIAELPHASGQGSSLRISFNGPYILNGPARLADHLGRTIRGGGPVALCRCGRSQAKPFCDGSHVAAEFTGAKGPRRVADHRDSYEGPLGIVFDNRGLCAHSGFCTDRLNGVFHLGEEPFVTPSGGRLDDIMRAVRRCPSGALSFGLDRREARAEVDQPREPSVEVSRNGPYRIVGSIPLLDEKGAQAVRLEGASMEHFSLCRCGSSLNKPFCSGMHWSVNFTDPLVDPNADPTLFEWAGGYPALLDMTKIFYGKYVPQDPLIGPLFATMSPDHPERVASWLSEVFGGPKFYSERYGGYARMLSQHVGKNITPEQRQRWASLMAQSADDAGLPADPEFRAAFLSYIEWGSRIAVENSTSDSVPPQNMPVPRWWWVCDATPGSRPSALEPRAQETSVWSPPAPGQPPEFDAHIKPLFRPMDRNSMKFAFDLWSEADVTEHGAAILARLKSGTMPCDGAWAPERVAVFEKWLGTVVGKSEFQSPQKGSAS